MNHAIERPQPITTNATELAENEYKYGQDALDSFTLAEVYRIELFASEREFPNLANPAQMSFDNRGRLWVAVVPSYPHFRPGDPRPNDKLLIYEDTNGDGKADRETVFADNLHLPIGFELAPEGVYLSQAPNLVLLQDLNGDDRADRQTFSCRASTRTTPTTPSPPSPPIRRGHLHGRRRFSAQQRRNRLRFRPCRERRLLPL